MSATRFSDRTRARKQRPCSHLGFSPNAYVCESDNAENQGTFIPNVTTRVSALKEAVLGPTYLGLRLLLCHLWVKSLIKGSVTALKAIWGNPRTTPLQWMRIDPRLQWASAFVVDFSLVLDFQSVI